MTRPDHIDQILRALGKTGRSSSDFDLEPSPSHRPTVKLRPAAVLVPILKRQGQLRVLLTKRSSALRHHPGQIAFPGGKVDTDDQTHEAAALREAWEEIALPPELVEILGCLPVHETVTGFQVTPVLGFIRAEFTRIAETGEVAEIFDVPLSHVTNMAQFSIQSRRWRGAQRRYYTVPYGPYYIWGATARILYGLAFRMAQ